MKAFLRSFIFAGQGVAYVLRTQRNARVHLLIAGLVVVAGILFHIAPVEWAVLAATIGMVICAEMLNTVTELAVDLVTQRYHPMAKAAKDTAAGAVLVTAVAAVGVGVAIFGPRLWALLFKR